MLRAILTGFEPFGEYRFNPTQDLVKEYDWKRIGNIEVIGLVLPCTYKTAPVILLDGIKRYSPDVVLSTGLASRVPRLRIEAVGRNFMSSKYADAKGVKADGEFLLQRGMEFYRTNADNDGLANLLHQAGIPVDVSVDPDAFVCNALIYLTARSINVEGIPLKFAFMHTPWTDDYVGKVLIEKGKITINEKILQKAAEIMMEGMAGSIPTIEFYI